MVDPAVPVDHRPPLPPPNPLLGQTVDGNPARSLVDRTPLDPAQIADPTREPYATRLWHEVERLRAQVQAVEALCDEAAFTIALRMADGFITYPKVVTVPKLRAALAVPAAEETTDHA